MQKDKNGIWWNGVDAGRAALMSAAFVLFALSGYGARANDSRSAVPLPDDVVRLMARTHICQKWTEIENDSSGERKDFMDHLVATMPILNWAQHHCGYEEIEAEVAYLRTLHKDNVFVPYALDHMLGLYKD